MGGTHERWELASVLAADVFTVQRDAATGRTLAAWRLRSLASHKLWTWQFSPGHIRVSRDGRLLFVNFGNEIVQFTLAP